MTYYCLVLSVTMERKGGAVVKKELCLTERPENFTDEYLRCCGNMSWYDFVVGMPSLVFVVTGWKSNGKENACLQSWTSCVGNWADTGRAVSCFRLTGRLILRQENPQILARELLSRVYRCPGLLNKGRTIFT